MKIFRGILAGSLALSLGGTALAESGVHPDRLVFGQVAAFEGPAAALGTGMRAGILAAFAEANAAGGVHGRQLDLVSEDDGYEPDRSAAHVSAMIASGDVFGFIGPVGTPTSKATQPLATAASVPFVGPFTGAGFLRDPAHGNVVNVRATYGAETEAWIKHLVDEKGFTKIAILYQDDAFGRVGLNGVTKALEKRGMTLAAEGKYERNTVAVKKAVLGIRKAKPDAVVMVGAYKPIAAFIKLAKKMKMDAVFMNISFVGSKALANELGADGEGVMVSQVVPFPWDDSVGIVAQYNAAIKKADASAEPDFVSLEGYITGRIAIAALEAAGQDLTRAGFLQAVWDMGATDLGGLSVSYGAADNQGLDDVFLTRINADGTFSTVATPGS